MRPIRDHQNKNKKAKYPKKKATWPEVSSGKAALIHEKFDMDVDAEDVTECERLAECAVNTMLF